MLRVCAMQFSWKIKATVLSIETLKARFIFANLDFDVLVVIEVDSRGDGVNLVIELIVLSLSGNINLPHLKRFPLESLFLVLLENEKGF